MLSSVAVTVGSAILLAAPAASDDPTSPDTLLAAADLDWGAVHAHQQLPRFWVFLEEKPGDATTEATAHLSPRAVERRARRRTAPGISDARDRPVDERVIATIAATGADVVHRSRWLNAVSVQATVEELARIEALPGVVGLRPVARSVVLETGGFGGGGGGGGCPSSWGLAEGQLDMIGITALHEAGFTGAGVVIGVLDTGFSRSHAAFQEPGHEIQVLAEWDFVHGDPDTGFDPDQDLIDGPNGLVLQHAHGTRVLSTIAAYRPCELVGGAPDAMFVLAKTEDVSQEVPAEEDAFVAGLEFIEAEGADLATSSLGYIDWYDWFDLDGLTAPVTVAMNTAIENGLICLTAVGNGGQDSDLPSLIAPSDAFDVLSVGAVDPNGVLSGFSSNGPTADDRLKPEVLAQGSSVWSVSVFDDETYLFGNGTSFATPLVASAVALILDAHPTWTVDQIRSALFAHGSYLLEHGEPDPLSLQGYGIVDAYASAQPLSGGPADLNGDGVVDGGDVGLLLAAWGTCAACPADLDGNGSVSGADLGVLLGAWSE